MEDLEKLRKACGCGISVARELLILAGGDVDLAINVSFESGSLNEAKVRVIDARFKKLEQE